MVAITCRIGTRNEPCHAPAAGRISLARTINHHLYPHQPPPRGHGGSHPYLVHEFVEAISQDRQPPINIWEAARYMAMGITAHQSALQDGERLAVPDWGDAPQ